MCLTTIETPRIAVKNIICFKHLDENNKSHVYVYQYVPMAKNPKQPLGIVDTVYITREVKVERGYHSWKTCKDHGNVDTYHANAVFMIPKGTTYIEGVQHDETWGYVSEDIVFLGRAGEFKTKLRTFLKTLF